MSLRLKDDDLLAITIKHISTTGTARYFDIHLYNKEHNFFERINQEVSNLTGYRISNSFNSKTYNSLIVNGVGQDMSKVLMERLFTKHNEAHGIHSDIDYYNKDKIFLNIARRDGANFIKYYDKIRDSNYNPIYEELKEVLPSGLSKDIFNFKHIQTLAEQLKIKHCHKIDLVQTKRMKI